MSKKRRHIPDAEKADSPSTFHARSAEGFKARHNRRFINANRHYDQLREWCDVLGITFRTANDELHWILKSDGRIVEWWPSTAKLVFDKQFNKGIHCHTVTQVMDTITKRWKLNQEHEHGNERSSQAIPLREDRGVNERLAKRAQAGDS